MRFGVRAFPDNLNSYNSVLYAVLPILDVLFSSFVLCVCIVAYWRSVWSLLDVYTKNLASVTSCLISTGIGLVGNLVLTFCETFFEHNFHPDKNRILFYVISRLYTACFAFTGVNSWRGPWGFLDIYYINDLLFVLVSTVIGIVALLVMRGLRNVTSSPFVIIIDDVKGYFENLTMFRTKVSNMISKKCSIP